MPADERVLDKSERDSLRALTDTKATNPEMRMPHRAAPRTYAAMGVWFLAVGGCMVGLTNADRIPEPNGTDDAWVGALMVLLFGGSALVVRVLVAETRAWREHRVHEYLSTIRYYDRIPRKDVVYKEGKAFRRIANGTDCDGYMYRGRFIETDSWTVYKLVEVAYEDVPPKGSDWADTPAAPWFRELPWVMQSAIRRERWAADRAVGRPIPSLSDLNLARPNAEDQPH